MTRAFTLRSIAVRWPRLITAVLVVAFGVATVTGALVFTDTTRAVFTQQFGRSVGGADIVVSGRSAAVIPDGVVAAIRRVSGVRAALGQVQQPVTIVGRNGSPLPAGRLPTVAISMVTKPFSGVTLVAGRRPRRIGEVAIDAATAALERWRVGSTVRLVTGQPVQPFRVVGIAAKSLGGQRFVVFSLGAEQALFAHDATVDRVLVAAGLVVEPRVLVREIAQVLKPGEVARVSGGAVQLDVSRVSSSFASLNGELLAFALVAVLVGALTIFGTFSITAAQRAGELALLRALGATRRQVVVAGLLEGLIVGMLGTLIGLGLGPLVALLIRAAFEGGGVALPSQGVVFRWRTVGAGAGVGVGVSLLAALVPALRATQAAPVEALRVAAGAGLGRRRRLGRSVRAVVAVALIAGGVVVMLLARGDDTRRLWMCGAGGGLLVIGALVAGPFLVALSAAIWRLRGGGRFGERDAVPGLARQNAALQPGRAALSGASLMIGVALAVVIGVYVGGLRAATAAAINQAVVGDIAIENVDGVSSIPATVVRAATAIPDVAAVSTLKQAGGVLAGLGPVPVEGIDPTSWGDVYRFAWIHGSPQVLATLGPGQVLVESNTSRAAGVSVGSRVTLDVSGGRRIGATVAGIYRDAGLLHGVALPLSWFDQLFAQSRLQGVFIKLSGFVRRTVALGALRKALNAFPGVVAHDQVGIARQLRGRLNGVVRLLYALLALTVVMSLLGVSGALTLSVRSRGRELGVLRALGMTPGQARRLVRLEGLLTVLVASVSGFLLGAGVGLALVHALSVEGFSLVVPWAALGAAAGASLLVALVATVGPARRAARVDILAAIAYE